MVLLGHFDKGAAFHSRVGGPLVEGATVLALPVASVAPIASVVVGAVVVPLLLAVPTIVLVAAEAIKRSLGPNGGASDTLDPGHGGPLLLVGQANA